MGRKKRLPKRNYPSVAEWKPFLSDVADAFHEKYGFEESYDLNNKLDKLFGWYRVDVSEKLDIKTINDQVKILDQLFDNCNSLLSIIHSLGQPEKKAIRIHSKDDFDISQFKETFNTDPGRES